MSGVGHSLQTIERGTSAEVIAGSLTEFFPDAWTVLDATYGSGMFWKGSALDVTVTGMDRNPERAPNIVGDFRALPFPDSSFDVVIFDPPYHTDMGKGKASVMGARFDTFATVADLRAAVEQGTREAWRVARLGVIVKVQDYVHNSRVQWMSDWVKAALAPMDAYDFVHLEGRTKIIDPKWTKLPPLSARRVHTTFWTFRHDGPVHKRRVRKPARRLRLSA